ncbi:MAG: hypothetical protein FK734_16275 [Asgard group archaeon]|nr:hypothetical protein [Asgard group archaeon]
MPKKKQSDKVSSSSKNDDVDLSDYEEEFDGEPVEKTDEVNLDEYELPEDFEIEEEEEEDLSGLNWIQRQKRKLQDLDNNQRLYWIKILSGCILGIILGFANAQTGWWLFLMIGLYAAITAGGYFLFKLEWNFKEVIFSGFFPYLALFMLTWTLMFTSIYAPNMSDWWPILETIVTQVTNNETIIFTSTRTTSAAGFPYLTFIIIITSTLGLLQFFLRRQKRREAKML